MQSKISSNIITASSFDSVLTKEHSEDNTANTFFCSASHASRDFKTTCTDESEDALDSISQLFENGTIIGMLDNEKVNIVGFDANNDKTDDNLCNDINSRHKETTKSLFSEKTPKISNRKILCCASTNGGSCGSSILDMKTVEDLLHSRSQSEILEDGENTTHLKTTQNTLDNRYLFIERNSDDLDSNNKRSGFVYVEENSAEINESTGKWLAAWRENIGGTYFSYAKLKCLSLLRCFNQTTMLKKSIIAGPIAVIAGAIIFMTVSVVLSTTTKKAKENQGSLLSIGNVVFSTNKPSFQPSMSIIPSIEPTQSPSQTASEVPTETPSISPSSFPSTSTLPTTGPTISSHPSSSPSSSPTYTPIIFYVMGDVPYSIQEEKQLYAQLHQVPEDARFLVHVGDIRQGKGKCKEKEFENVKNILQSSDYPVFIVPGDNDILDCSNVDQAKSYWDKRFLSFENNWEHSLPVQRQAARQENFSFFQDNVLFIGLNIVGGDGYTTREWTRRLDDNLDWALAKMNEFRDSIVGLVIFGHGRPMSRHNEFFAQLTKEIESLGVPSLYIHGDGHTWKLKKESFGVKQLLRVQVDRGGIAAPLKVTFQRDAESPFEFSRNYPMRSLPPSSVPSKMPTISPRPSPDPTPLPTPRPTRRRTPRPIPRPTRRPIPPPNPRPTRPPVNRPPPPPPPQPQCCALCFWCW